MKSELELATKELSVRELKFVAAILAGNSQKSSALIAGFSETRAKNTGSQLMKRPHIRRALGLAIDNIGVTFEEAIQPVRDALRATKYISDTKNGEMIDSGLPDHGTRLKASAIVLKMMGKFDQDNGVKPPAAYNHDNAGIMNALKDPNIDEVTLQQMVFKKNS